MRPNSNRGFKIRPEIYRVSPYIPGKPIDEVKRELGIEDVIKLASNELPYGPPLKVRQAVFEVAKELNRYPDSHSYYLRQKISEKFGISPECIVFGNGSSELIKLIADAVIVEGDRVIYADPSFVMYPIVATSRGAVKVEVPLTADDLAHDLNRMLEMIDDSVTMVIICNPNNPTGTITRKKQIYDFLKNVPPHILIMFDEAYAEFVTDKDFVSGVEIFKEGLPNVCVLRSFSKAYGLAGLRLGYGFVPEELADAVNRIREPFNINLVAQAAALACLDCEEEYEEIRQIVIRERERMEAELSSSGFTVYRSQANFIFVDSSVDSTLVFKKLLKKGVITRDGSIFGERFKTFLRVTIGTPEENDRFLSEFPLVVEEIRRGDF
ncbi:MAG: histidinol-phosphate transaminase [Actinobacteria bacterium]|nr:histidinol-phosphate transaminase [Actinomycetota bacterium]